jgi:hypothetical protein
VGRTARGFGERLESWRERRRERFLERAVYRMESGGRPSSGGLAFQLLALAVLAAIVVAVFVLSYYATR